MADESAAPMPSVSARTRPPEAGQALVEFSLVAPIFLFLLFFAMTAGFYTLERAGAVNATTAGARIAAGARPADLNQPALIEARTEAVRLLGSSMPGTRIAVPSGATDACPDLAAIPAATVYVCVSAPTAETVRVQVIGHPASFVAPQAGGLNLPLDIYAHVHTAVFKQ
jgi:Flp pilus assembly protein TadG